MRKYVREALFARDNDRSTVVGESHAFRDSVTSEGTPSVSAES
jgi:hypothetical protein